MAYVRLPAVIAVPLCAIGAVVWIGQGIASLTAAPKVTIYADAESAMTVEVLDSKQKVEQTIELGAGERATLTARRGAHTIRSTKRDGAKHEVAVKLGLGEQHAVPTSADQCFAVLNIGAWYGARHREADVVDAKVERRLKTSAPFEFPDQTYGTLQETPESIEAKDHPKLVTAYPCSKIAGAADSDILATLEHRLTMSSATLTSIMLTKKENEKERPIATSGREAFTRLMGEQKKDWMRVHDDSTTLAYRNGSGEFLIIDAWVIPRELEESRKPGATADFVANIEKAEAKGVYHKTDVLPSFDSAPGRFDPKVEVGGREAGIVLRRPNDVTNYKVAAAVLLAIGGDMKELAIANARARFATAKCLSKITAKPTSCTTDATEATGVLLAATESPAVKGKVWFRLDARGLQVAKAAKKVPSKGIGDTTFAPSLFTLHDHELTVGLE